MAQVISQAEYRNIALDYSAAYDRFFEPSDFLTQSWVSRGFLRATNSLPCHQPSDSRLTLLPALSPFLQFAG